MALFLPSFGFGSIFYVGVLLVNAVAVCKSALFLFACMPLLTTSHSIRRSLLSTQYVYPDSSLCLYPPASTSNPLPYLHPHSSHRVLLKANTNHHSNSWMGLHLRRRRTLLRRLPTRSLQCQVKSRHLNNKYKDRHEEYVFPLHSPLCLHTQKLTESAAVPLIFVNSIVILYLLILG
jgi:hypothetical protein